MFIITATALGGRELQTPSLPAVVEPPLTLAERQPKMEVPRKLTPDVLSISTCEIPCATALVPIVSLRSRCQC